MLVKQAKFKGTLKLKVNHSKSLEVKGQGENYKSRLTAIADRLTARVKKSDNGRSGLGVL